MGADSGETTLSFAFKPEVAGWCNGAGYRSFAKKWRAKKSI